jgi:hypothetical protein
VSGAPGTAPGQVLAWLVMKHFFHIYTNYFKQTTSKIKIQGSSCPVDNSEVINPAFGAGCLFG